MYPFDKDAENTAGYSCVLLKIHGRSALLHFTLQRKPLRYKGSLNLFGYFVKPWLVKNTKTKRKG